MSEQFTSQSLQDKGLIDMSANRYAWLIKKSMDKSIKEALRKSALSYMYIGNK